MFIIIVFGFGSNRPSGPFFSCPLYLIFSTLRLLFSPSSVSLYYFILAIQMRECLGKFTSTSSTFPILNGTFFPTVRLHEHRKRSRRDSIVG